MTRKVFAKLMALFVLLLVFETAAMELILRRMMAQSSADTLHEVGRDAIWSGVIALLIALPIAAWVASRITARLQRVMEFAGRIAEGDLKARLEYGGGDEISEMEKALNKTAERLGNSFAEIESSRRELATMLDSMQEAVVAVSADGQVRWSNAVMKKMTGTEIRAGRPLVHSVRAPELLDCIREAQGRGEVQYGRTSSLAPGRIFEISAAPLPEGGAIAVLHDVTRVEAAEQSRRDFIANVSHELRTPLTSIQGYVETLVDAPNPDPAMTKDFLNVILKNATRMNRLTEDLLALATIESPDYRLATQPATASGMVRDAIDALGGLVVDSGIDLQYAGAPDATVMVDPDAMNQVFGNLIENAVKYGKAGKKIKVGARALDNEIEFFVQDFGPGIASEHLARIFERFYRVDKARSREAGGTGLGLAIVKHVVQAHGGRVRAESELGSGTTFLFTLPASTEKRREEMPADSAARARVES
ncbi:MAG: HAMP domain-containing protein [Acidobacteria bacterium]|nr:HAMP domain-containing protein [Acidobacteriota bacterium]